LTTLNNQLIAALAANGDTINKRMFQDSIIDAITNQPDHPINVALRDNDTYDWAPAAPTRLYYCGADEQVPFQNSLIAEAKMQANGATDVQAINLNPNFSHTQCVFPAILSSIDFFQSFLNSSGIADLDRKAGELNVSPNPASDQITIEWEKAIEGMNYEILNAGGQTVSRGHSYLNRIAVDKLASGIYVVVCTAGGQTRMARFVRL
jgi:hypothetical protein